MYKTKEPTLEEMVKFFEYVKKKYYKKSFKLKTDDRLIYIIDSEIFKAEENEEYEIAQHLLNIRYFLIENVAEFNGYENFD